MTWNDLAKYYVNLEERTDRRAHMEAMLKSRGIEAERVSAFHWKDVDYENPLYRKMYERTPGAIGCYLSQVYCMRKAQDAGKSVLIMEDDLQFTEDFVSTRVPIIEKFCNGNTWDVMFLGGTVHYPVPQWHTKGHTNPELPPSMCNCNLDKDAEPTGTEHIFKAFGAWSTYCYIVNYQSIEKILRLFNDHIQTSIGIDWLYIKLSPQLNNFIFLPGSCKQIDGQSNIGNGITRFSAFSMLGKHWYSENINDFK